MAALSELAPLAGAQCAQSSCSGCFPLRLASPYPYSLQYPPSRVVKHKSLSRSPGVVARQRHILSATVRLVGHSKLPVTVLVEYPTYSALTASSILWVKQLLEFSYRSNLLGWRRFTNPKTSLCPCAYWPRQGGVLLRDDICGSLAC